MELSSELIKNETNKVPIEVLNKIRNAWIAGIISTTLTVVFALISILAVDISGVGLDASAFFDAVLMLIFTFGIYKKSRTCAILMLLLFVLNKVLMLQASGVNGGIIVALIFLWYYVQGVIGTFQYHKLKQESQA